MPVISMRTPYEASSSNPVWGAGRSFIAVSLAGLLIAWLIAHQVDFPWARFLYRLQGGQWALREHVLLEPVLHVGGRWLSALAWLSLAVATVSRWRTEACRSWTRPAARLLLAVLVSTVLVSWLKDATHMDCPWDLVDFGGTRPFIPLLSARPESLGTPACFPAGHASGGYAWVALFFFLAEVRPRWRWRGLAIGLVAGLLFGFAQQLRGAHFLSHDVATLAICWAVACSIEVLRQWRAGPLQRSRA